MTNLFIGLWQIAAAAGAGYCLGANTTQQVGIFLALYALAPVVYGVRH